MNDKIRKATETTIERLKVVAQDHLLNGRTFDHGHTCGMIAGLQHSALAHGLDCTGAITDLVKIAES
jgi:hypothetical protein